MSIPAQECVQPRSGFTLVETLVAIAVLSIVLVSAALMMRNATTFIGEARARAQAASIAQDRIELAHNVSFTDLGTVGGIPAGTLPQNETVSIGALNFQVYTSVVYIDDPFDGEAPIDTLPIDYKRVRVEVSWSGPYASRLPLVIWTDIAPKGLEFMPGAGTLSVLVFNAQGEAVENAQVHIEAEGVTPAVDLDAYTDTFGRVILPGAQICIDCYQITVSRSGYTTDRTYGTEEVVNPAKPHLSVLEGQVSEVSFALDQVSAVTIRAVRPAAQNYGGFAGVQVRIRGTKEIGRTVSDEPVYKVNQTAVTGFGGQTVVNGLEWDTYTIELPVGSSVDYAGSWPFSPLTLTPGQSAIYSMVVVPATPHSLLVRITDNLGAPLASAAATLINPGNGQIASRSAGLTGTPDWSQVHFSGLAPQMYTLEVFSTGYQTATASVTISGDKQEIFQLLTL